jgi:hypothetical protein
MSRSWVDHLRKMVTLDEIINHKYQMKDIFITVKLTYLQVCKGTTNDISQSW